MSITIEVPIPETTADLLIDVVAKTLARGDAELQAVFLNEFVSALEEACVDYPRFDKQRMFIAMHLTPRTAKTLGQIVEFAREETA